MAMSLCIQELRGWEALPSFSEKKRKIIVLIIYFSIALCDFRVEI
jgi:hypothetical protein